MFILGSASPRRKAILESANFIFETVPNGFDESSVSFDVDVEKFVETLAVGKAKYLLNKYQDKVILSADTVVEVDGKILGKPVDEADAEKMLYMLSDRSHNVFTGVCIISSEKVISFVESATVNFNKLSSLDIKQYVQTNEPMDKAGAYAIQGIGSKFIKSYEGDFHTIMGLPLKIVIEKLKAFEIYPNIK